LTSRALRRAAEFKDLKEPLPDFIVRRAGSIDAHRGMLVALSDTDNR
jgi:hypothetical protein